MGTISLCKSICGLFSKILILFIISFFTKKTIAQYQLPGYLLAQSPNKSVKLYTYNSANNTWKLVGSTGRNNIKSLAIHSNYEIIYAVDGGTLGKLNPKTGRFTAIGNIGSGNGENGTKTFNNIYGLAFDANRNILYATNRNNNGIDELIKINPITGKIIKNSMRNAAGARVDYKVMNITTFYFGGNYTSYKFFDLAYDSDNAILYMTHNYFSTLHGINGFKNIDSQNPVEEFRVSPIQKLSGIDLDESGKMYGCFTDNQVSDGDDLNSVGGGVNNFFRNLQSINSSESTSTTFFGLDFYKIDYCDQHIILNNPLISNCPKIAKSTISSNTLIDLNVRFTAGNTISLNNNFEVKRYANFEAIIDRFCN